jgi:hypothetical protein
MGFVARGAIALILEVGQGGRPLTPARNPAFPRSMPGGPPGCPVNETIPKKNLSRANVSDEAKKNTGLLDYFLLNRAAQNKNKSCNLK